MDNLSENKMYEIMKDKLEEILNKKAKISRKLDANNDMVNKFNQYFDVDMNIKTCALCKKKYSPFNNDTVSLYCCVFWQDRNHARTTLEKWDISVVEAVAETIIISVVWGVLRVHLGVKEARILLLTNFFGFEVLGKTQVNGVF